ncbi:MAG TPA: hypothetical protein VFW34_10140 [Candidatus Rubrimentiphilum sp.]|nr:hypothetical protein [Candidatus Rubrimentiphilum sp.]
MSKRLPLWIAAVVPSMAAGHVAGYALSGFSAADGRHGWLSPAIEIGVATLIALSALIVAATLLRAGIFRRSQIESSVLALAPRLAASQLVLFVTAETVEGRTITPAGIATQIISALLAAYMLSLVAKLVERCIACADEAGSYLERLTSAICAFALIDPAPRTITLFASAGTSRFQRPPPFAVVLPSS